MITTPAYDYSAFWEMQQQEKRRLKSASLYVGFCMLGVLVMANLVGTLASGWVSGFENQYNATGEERYFFLYILAMGLIYCLYMALPVPILSLFMRRSPLSPYKPEPIGGTATALLIGVGLAGCIFANMATGYYVFFLESIGFPVSTEPELTLGTGWPAWLAQLAAIALLPGIFEELVFRGYVLQALRPFGDRMAIFWSALLFGLVHGNMEQMPFAFILGLILGFMVVKTGRLWISMVVHFLNNVMAVTIEYLQKGKLGVTIPEDETGILYVFAGVTLAGLLCAGVLLASRHRVMTNVTDTQSVLPKAQRTRAFLQSPTVIISLVLMVLTAILQTIYVAMT